MKLQSDVLSQLDLRAATDSVLDLAPKLLPPTVLRGELDAHREELASWVEQCLEGGFYPTREETIPVNKSSHGVRPVAVWDSPSRVTYVALVHKIGQTLPPLDRGAEQWKSFQRKPLDSAGRYIVSSDIASFYQYIDHGLMRDELLIRGCDPACIDAVLILLRETSGKTYGLPQQSAASDVLAECFINRLQRSLVRRRLNVARYNDDLRFTCDTWSDAVEAIETLTEEARINGLAINDLKTISWTRENYEASLDRADQLQQEIMVRTQLDLTEVQVNGYDNTVTFVEPESSAVKIAGAFRVLQEWSEMVGDSADVPDEQASRHRALVQLLPVALKIIQAGSTLDDEMIEICAKILRFERTITPTVARLLQSSDEYAAIGVFDRLQAANAYMNRWQTWWLQQPVARRPTFLAGREGHLRRDWLTSSLEDFRESPSITANIALTLAQHQGIDFNQLLRLFDRSSIAVRPVLAMAIAKLNPTSAVRDAVTADSPESRWAFDAA